VIWGALNGFYLILEILVETGWKKLAPGPWWEGVWRSYPVRLARVGYTFSLICLSWVFFRANSVNDAFYILRHLFDGVGRLRPNLGNLPFVKMNILMQQDKTEFLIALVCLATLLAVDLAQRHATVPELIARRTVWVRWGLYYATILALLFFGAFNTSQQFIYFQF
jgi:alginate O-acetyltransferase complex protein AlgI